MNQRTPSGYWLYWIGLVLLLLFSVVMTGAADWSHAMEKRMGLGFFDDVVNPIVALCLSRDSLTFQETLGIGDVNSATAAPLPDIEKDVNSAIAVLQRDYFFLILYAAVFLLLARYLWRTGIIRKNEKPLMMALLALPVITAVADLVENYLALAVLSPTRDEVKKQAETIRTPVQATATTWRELQKENVLLVPGGLRERHPRLHIGSPEEDVAALLKKARAEGADLPTLTKVQQAPNLNAAETLLAETYDVRNKTPIIEKIREACQVRSPLMHISSALKWLSAFILVTLLGGLMIRPRGSARRMPGLDWCLGGLLLVTGGIVGLWGILAYPVCIQPALLFTAGAFVPLFIGGLRRFMICATGTLR